MNKKSGGTSSAALDAAHSLWAQFKRSGNLDDLDNAVRMHRQALELTSIDNPYYAALLSEFGAVLEIRFERRGEFADLEEALDLHRRALELTRTDSPSYAALLSNLGAALSEAGRQQEALTAGQEAVAILRR